MLRLVKRHIPGMIVRADIADIAAVLQAAHLDRLLRRRARVTDGDIGNRQILIVAEDEDVAAAAATGVCGGVVGSASC